MATASATILSSTVPTAAVVSPFRSSQRRTNNVNFIKGLSSFGGLKAQNGVVSSLGLPICTERSFAKIVSSLKTPSSSNGGKNGGAMTSTCNAADEIFRIAAIMNGLTLVGVAVGFVLLRIEAFVEEE